MISAVLRRAWCSGATFAAAVGALALATQACATSGDLERVEARVAQLEEQREQLLARMQEDVARLEKLHSMLTEAEETLRKSGANLGIRVEQLEQQSAKTVGQAEALTFRLDRMEHDVGVIKRELADRLGSTALFLPPNVPKDKDGMWAEAKKQGAAGKLQESRAIYELYESSFPDDIRAPHALWEIAKLYEGAGDKDNAIKFYQLVHDRYGSSEIAPGAVMRIAEINVERGQCGLAKDIYNYAASTYRNTPTGNEAKKRARTVLKDCKK